MSKVRGAGPSELDEARLAVGPIDGRYRARTRALVDYFSEYALIRYRVRIEIEWYLFLADTAGFDALAPIDDATREHLRAIHRNFTLADARRIKEIEAVANHDVKAVEYFLREKFAAIDPALPLEAIHFACTSEDISNLAWALMIREFVENILLPALATTVGTLGEMAR